MSETRTPTAAEVMGWPTATVPRSDGTPIPYLPPDCDDMLKWLRGRDWDAYVYFGWDTEGLVRLTVTHPSGAMDDYDFPTLHAALEAAVIAVGRDY